MKEKGKNNKDLSAQFWVFKRPPFSNRLTFIYICLCSMKKQQPDSEKVERWKKEKEEDQWKNF